MLLEHDVIAGPRRRRYHYGSAPSGAISVAAFGLRGSGNCNEHPTLCLGNLRARAALARYFNAVDDALGADWLDPERPAVCTVAEAFRVGSSARLAPPCIRLDCAHNLLGHLDRFGLPVVYHRSAVGRLSCMWQLEADPSLAEVGRVLGISRERARQIEEVGLRRARVASRQRWVVRSTE